MSGLTILLALLALPGGQEPASSGSPGNIEVAILEPGLPAFRPLERRGAAAAHTASITMPDGNGNLFLVDLEEDDGSSLWQLRRFEDGRATLARAQEGWNTLVLDPETETRRRLHLTLDRSRREIHYVWGEAESVSAFREWDAAPKLEATLLSGDTFRLAELAGTTVVLNWWAIWCAPCVEEMPQLNTLVREYEGRPVEFVAIAQNTPEEVQQFLRDREFLYDQAVGTDATAQVLGEVFPRHVVVAPDGVVMHSQAGFGSESIAEIREALRAVLDRLEVPTGSARTATGQPAARSRRE